MVDKVLIDGSSLLYRSWHAMPPLTAPDGSPVGAVRGFANSLGKLAKMYPQADLLMVFDTRAPTFRHEKYPRYKAHRKPMDDDLRAQIAPIHRLVAAKGMPLLLLDGWEADDIIATVAQIASKAGEKVIIFTQDKDLAQCVDAKVSLLRNLNEEPMGVQAVANKYEGVVPALFPDWLALAGDQADGIPGVQGIGAKKAAKLLATHGSIAGVMEAAPSMFGKDGKSLQDALPDLPLYLDLVRVRTDVPLATFELKPSAPDEAALLVLYEELGFSEVKRAKRRAEPESPEEPLFSLQQQVKQPADDDGEPRFSFAQPVKEPPEQLDSLKQLLSWLQQGWKKPPVALFFALDYPNQAHSPVAGLGLADDAGRRAFLKLAGGSSSSEMSRQIRAELQQHAGLWLLPDIKSSLVCAADAGFDLPEGAHDPLLRSYLLSETSGRHELEVLAVQQGHFLRSWHEIAGKGKSQVALSQLPWSDAAELAAERAVVAVQIEKTLRPKMDANPKLAKLYAELELPLAHVLADMEGTGVLVDRERLEQQSKELLEQVKEIQSRIQEHEQVGENFNPDSPSQVGAVLFENMKLPVRSKTKSGKPSTAEEVLERLAADGEKLPSQLLEYRRLRKLLSTYTLKLPQQIRASSGRVHTSYHQAVVATGRLSSTDPNLQNIPIRTPEGRRVRSAFRAPAGWVLLAPDYSQIELRVLAHLSEDTGLIQAFTDGVDIHAALAFELFGQKDDESRRRAKTINFGLIYGMSAFGLARQLQVPQAEARQFIEIYFQRFPKARQFMDTTRSQAVEHGYVETIRGRRLYLSDINTGSPARKQAAQRAAINAPMQGTAADIIKQAMLDVHSWLREDSEHRGRLLMQVHDELVLEVPVASADETAEKIVSLMQSAEDLRVPLVVNMGRGDDWEHAKASG